jgi:nitroimidazol reductase NimA-like FMN-containing flavoprotein (pyridoxamine 5'-phosphate oxidase superfamily)
MSKTYTFEADTYKMDGYPSLVVAGRYAVLSREAQRLAVRFTDTLFDGSPRPDSEVWMQFSDCGRTLVFDGMTYTRSAP